MLSALTDFNLLGSIEKGVRVLIHDEKLKAWRRFKLVTTSRSNDPIVVLLMRPSPAVNISEKQTEEVSLGATAPSPKSKKRSGNRILVSEVVKNAKQFIELRREGLSAAGAAKVMGKNANTVATHSNWLQISIELARITGIQTLLLSHENHVSELYGGTAFVTNLYHPHFLRIIPHMKGKKLSNLSKVVQELVKIKGSTV